MYELLTPIRFRSGATIFMDEQDAQHMRKSVKGVKILRCYPEPSKKVGGCKMISINPQAFSDTSEVLLDKETGSAVIL